MLWLRAVPILRLRNSIAPQLVLERLGDAVSVHLRLELRYLVGQYQKIMLAAIAILHLIAQQCFWSKSRYARELARHFGSSSFPRSNHRTSLIRATRTKSRNNFYREVNPDHEPLRQTTYSSIVSLPSFGWTQTLSPCSKLL